MRRGAPINAPREPAGISMEDMESGGAYGMSSSHHSSSSNMSMSPSTSSGNIPMDHSMSYAGDKEHKPRKSKSFSFSAPHMPRGALNDSLKTYVFILVGVVFVFSFILPLEYKILMMVFGSCGFGAIASVWLSHDVLSCDDGTPEMRAVSDPIREGADGFLRVQYSVSANHLSLILSFAILK